MPSRGWVDRGLSDHSIFTSSELCAILDAVSLVCQRGVNSVIICNSNPALQSISAVKHTQTLVVQQSLSFDIPKPVCQIFMDVRSCKEICSLSLRYYLSRVHSAALFPIWRRRDKEMPFSVTINHYESPRRNKYIYRRQGLTEAQCRFHTPATWLPPSWQAAWKERLISLNCQFCRAQLSVQLNTIA